MVTTATTKITTLESTTITITLENVENVTVLRQNETSITLKWEKVDNIQTYRLQYNDNGNITVEIISESNGTSVEYVVSPLTAGTKYDFILFTVLDDDNSTGHPFTAVTAPENVVNVTVLRQNETSITLKWEKVNNIQTYRLQYNDNGNITVENISESNGTSVEYVVSPLTAGTEYDFTLFTVFYNVPSSGRNISAVTDLGNVKNVAVLRRNETSITLKWEKVNNIQTYRLQYNHNGNITVEIISESNGTSVEYVVSPLTAGTKYDFILFTVLDDDNSTGYPFTAVTAPENVENVTVLRQNENSITLKWEKVDNIQTYRLQYNDNGNITVENIIESNGTSVEYVVSFLTAGTKYDFTLFTVFEDANSNGHPFTAVTAPENVKNVTVLRQNETSITLKWEKVNNIQTYMLQYNDNGNITVENISESNGTSVEYVVSPLTAGTKYDFTLFTVFYNVPSSGQNISAVTVPGNVKNVTVLRQNETSITLKWETVNNIQTYRLQYNHNGNITVEIISESNGTSVEYVVSPLTAGTKYDFILFTVLDDDNSTGHPFTAVTAPENVENVTVLRQNETSITLKWEKVNNIETYRLQYNDNGNITVENISESNGTSVEYVVSPLTAGTEYDFTLFTVFYNVPSSGRNISAVTDLGNVKSVAVLRRNETSITLKWEKVNNIQTYRLQYNHNGNITVEIISESNGTSVEYVVSPLTAATKYDFILFTVLDDDNSTGYPFTAITAPENVKNVIVLRENETSITLKWEKLNNMQTYRLQYNDNGNITVENIIESNGTQSVEYVVSPLTAGTKYDFTLFAVFYDVPSSGRNISAVTAIDCTTSPWDVTNSSIKGKIEGLFSEARATNGSNRTHVSPGGGDVSFTGLYPGSTYEVSLWYRLDSEDLQQCIRTLTIIPADLKARCDDWAAAYSISIRWDEPEGVWTHVEVNVAGKTVIPAGMFPDHFNQMSADDNRGFSEEYESFIPVGTEQTRKAAVLPDNKAKNRFTNVLPYDWSRVKLTTLRGDENSDYINANYMPGCNSNRQYIAAQGPLPSTVNDFWCLIWEQSVKGVVMVTNCTEGGRVKCEQYWPLDYTPCRYGDLLVTIISEQPEPNWTLREFAMKNKQTGEERAVKHFHFTAWPDHGVPDGTEALIQFRGLVREHIENEGGRTPTLVHCSAGVGRTGTIIALDVLLQQLQGEKEVGIAAFVHKMRLSRPLMVQTESQYVFLHQCIMNTLQKDLDNEENIYENSDMIYANATALREFRSRANT
ncbi:receptor-type tyrosine-protein phosphatase H-like [Diretmus argenteus]